MKKAKIGLILAWVGGILMILAMVGGYKFKGAIDLINKDKMFLMDTISDSFSKDRKGPAEVVKLVPAIEAKYGKFKGISRVDGIPVMSDTLKAGGEFAFQVSADFEKGPITFETRVSNTSDTPKLLEISYKEGHFARKRVRNAFKELFR
jgi:hypothetical protein